MLIDEKNQLMQKMRKYEINKKPLSIQSLAWQNANLQWDIKRRHRRTAGEIDRHYKCPIANCGKSYGYI